MSILRKDGNLSKMIFGALIVAVFSFIFGPAVFAQFYLNTTSTGFGSGFGYGYGYGYGPNPYTSSYRTNGTNPLTAYGYGYGFGSAPVISLSATSSTNVNSGSIAAFTISATDQDVTTPGVIAYSMTGQPSGATLNSSTGAFSWNTWTAQAAAGVYTFTVKAAGSTGGIATSSVSITVNAGPGSGGGSAGGNTGGNSNTGGTTTGGTPPPPPPPPGPGPGTLSPGVPYPSPVGSAQIRSDINYLKGQLLLLLEELLASLKAGQGL